MSYHNGPRIVTEGLILCLDAGNPKSYPGSGNTWYDLSGNNNHFILVSSIFDNTNKGSLSYGNNIRIYKTGPIFSGDNNLTIMSFFYGNFLFMESQSAGAARNNLSSTSTTSMLDQYGPSGTGSRIDLTYSSNSANKILAHRIYSDRTANWFYNGFFSDGGTDETYSWSPMTPEVTEIGNRTISGNSNYYGGIYNGKLGVLLLYNIPLTNNQISQNYNALKGRFAL